MRVVRKLIFPRKEQQNILLKNTQNIKYTKRVIYNIIRLVCTPYKLKNMFGMKDYALGVHIVYRFGRAGCDDRSRRIKAVNSLATVYKRMGISGVR